MSVDKVTLFENHGPAATGLIEWETIDPATLESGAPVQHGHGYYDDAASGIMAGVWDCTPMTGRMEPYAVDEFMHILEGSVTIVHEDGSEFTVSAGENFVIPKGTMCIWKQPEYVRKFYVIFDDPYRTGPADSASLRAFKIDPGLSLEPVETPDTDATAGDSPEQHERSLYEDPTGRFRVGLWQSAPFEMASVPFDRCELMVPLEGSMTLICNGAEITCRPGDVPFVPVGADCGWKSTETVKKIYCIVMPDAAMTGPAG